MRTIVLIVVCLIAFSCKQEKANVEEPSKMEEVMAIHDEVMPKMTTISKLVGELKPIADTAQAGSPYEIAMKDLQAAHKSMMDWMKGFGDRFDSEEILKGKALPEEKQRWLEEEEIKVKVMRDQVNSSIENAEKLLNK
ncbi:hypothetical protein [Robertkochia flava]|uniref:hypothetical protein n=1 Tax=Robertkochia flava TaxID=3447986 RepID=UPI001CCA91B6|nr:hypothetical protein [Robertkochia marina]